MMTPRWNTRGNTVTRLGLALGWCVLVSVSGAAAQPEATPPPTPAQLAEAITDILNQAAQDVETAEQGGADAQEAFARAQQRIEAVRKRDPRNVRAEYYQARLEILGGQPNLAIHKLRDWVHSRQGENDWQGHFILGKLFFDTQYYKMAEPELQKAADLNPREASILALMSRCATKLIKREPAVRYAREAVEMMGSDVDVDMHVLLADALVLDEKLDDAERAARTAREQSLARLKSAGTSVETLAKANQCIQLCLDITQSRLKVDPTNASLYLDISRLIQEQAEIASLLAAHNAAQWTLQGLQQAGDGAPPELVIEAARLLTRIGRDADALKVVAKGREVFPQSDAIKELYDTLSALAPKDEPPPAPAEVPAP